MTYVDLANLATFSRRGGRTFWMLKNEDIYIYTHTYFLRGVSTLRFSQIRMCPFCMVRFCIHLHIELVASFLLNAHLRNRYPCLDCLLIASRQNCSLLQLRPLGKMMLRHETSLSKVTNFKIE